MVQSADRRVIVLAGPTGVGKTDLAIEIAELLAVEIISADSRFVKPCRNAQERVMGPRCPGQPPSPTRVIHAIPIEVPSRHVRRHPDHVEDTRKGH